MDLAAKAQVAGRDYRMTNNSREYDSSVQSKYFCRGCGSVLPVGFRGHFHRECLRADKRRRVSERRRREQEMLKRQLEKYRCSNCGARYADQGTNRATTICCEASRSLQEGDPPPGRCPELMRQDVGRDRRGSRHIVGGANV
jgi:hypothetical protein